ncbi:hypothetical protein TNCV_4374801 [Trichonephila clavipes]|uniref:Uncharacterized protein n=1 Tax=Trichonephila clavipes TaxID=2585209 RepID=A0A8X7BDK3_TRICX|nr:hypothetical protein TNCV_4374801 [Trichonephila clavipes]
MAEIRVVKAAERLATRLEDARLRVRQSCSTMTDELRSQQREPVSYKWLKDVNMKQHIGLIIALHSGTT